MMKFYLKKNPKLEPSETDFWTVLSLIRERVISLLTQSGTWTHTALQPPDFESSMSTNSIIWAWTNFDCFVFQMNVHQFSRSAGFFLPEIFCTMFENFSISRTSSGHELILIKNFCSFLKELDPDLSGDWRFFL